MDLVLVSLKNLALQINFLVQKINQYFNMQQEARFPKHCFYRCIL